MDMVTNRRREWTVVIMAAVLASLATPARAADRSSVAFSLQRNDLLSERIALKRELKGVDDEIRAAEKPVYVAGTVAKASTVHGMRAGYLSGLREQRRRLLDRIAGVDQRFERLSDRVVAHYGAAPSWWSDIK
jgi:hypothetical protein